MRKFIILILVCILAVGGCAAAKSQSQSQAVAPKAVQGVAADQAKVYESAATTGEQKGTPTDQYPRKVVQNRDVNLLVQDVRQSIDAIKDKVQNSGGYVQELNLNDSERVSGNLVLRIPVQGLAEFDKFLSGLGKVRSDNLRTEDITGAYYDADARLDNQKTQEKRLLELLNQAKTMDDILKLEAEISKTREQIEVLQGQINRWNQQVDYATIHLTLEPKDQVSQGGVWEPLGLGTAFTAAKNGVLVTLKVVYHLVSWLVVILGYLLPVAIIAGPVAYLWWRKRRANTGKTLQ